MTDTFNPWANVPLTEAIPGGAGTTPQGDPTALSGMLSGVMNMPKHLIDAAKESAAHNYGPGPAVQSDSWVDPLPAQAAQTAMALGGMGAPAAEAGAAGIFGGRLAKTADLKALQEAEKMRMSGMHPDEVVRDTGWQMSPADNKWRFEIPDNKSALATPYLLPGEKVSGAVSSAISHEPLFNAYPELAEKRFELSRNPEVKNLNIVSRENPLIKDNDVRADQINKPSGLWSDNTAYVTAPDQKQAHSVLLHELQHGIQDIEGFSPGANPNYYAGQIEKGMRNKPDLMKGFDFNMIRDKANHLYHNTAGEVEARNTQLRQFLSPEQRRVLPPYATQDVPYGDQYHFDRNTEMLNALRQK